jgi:hypothetical protein
VVDRQNDDGQSAAVSLIEGGAEMAGAAAGGAAGFVIGGPGGAALGGAGGVVVTRAVKRLGGEIQRWVLGPMGEVRVGAATAYAYDSISVRIMAGDTLRDDEPWREDSGRGRTAAEEVLEGVLRTAADSWEQRKVRYVGLFYASLAFRPDVGPAYANTLLRMAGALGYRQLEVLTFFNRYPSDPRLISIDGKRAVNPGLLPDGLGYEVDTLGDMGLLGAADALGEVKLAAAYGPSLSTQHRYGTLALTFEGRTLHDLMRLDTIPQEDVDGLWALLEASVGGAPTRGRSLWHWKDPFGQFRSTPRKRPG